MNHYPILFISLGPGDPELITLKGWKALQAADIVFCPETEGRNGERTSRAANIVRWLGVGDDHIRRFLLPMSKRREAALQAYDGVYAEARALQDEGLHVCIVAEGDAGFYSSVHYVFERLRADGRAAEHVALQEPWRGCTQPARNSGSRCCPARRPHRSWNGWWTTVEQWSS